MITAKIEGAKEFSSALKTAMMKTSKAVPVFLHDQAQRFMWQMYSTFKAEKPLLTTIQIAAEISLESGKGLRVNRRNLARAKRLMGVYQSKIRERLGKILARERITKSAREKARELLRNRKQLLIRHRGHNRQILPRKAEAEGKRILVPAGVGNTKVKKESRYNLPALAARYEINRRRSGSGSMAQAFLSGYRQLRAYPLGSPFIFSQICKDKHTWGNKGELRNGRYMLDLVLENKGFRGERQKNYDRVSRVMKARTSDLIAHANRVVKEAWKK